MLRTGGNVLLLDEPTNDLDVDTLRALEEALLAFPGCAVVISHDRWFLDRIATHMLAFEGDSQVQWYEGSYSDYEADRKRRLGADADGRTASIQAFDPLAPPLTTRPKPCGRFFRAGGWYVRRVPPPRLRAVAVSGRRSPRLICAVNLPISLGWRR